MTRTTEIERAICTVLAGTSPFPGASEAILAPTRIGFSLDVVDRALESGQLSLAELDRLVLPRKTLAHRRILGSLTPDQSDRFGRLLRTIHEAEDTFGDRAKAHAWLRRPTPLLDGESPLDRLDTDIGTRYKVRGHSWPHLPWPGRLMDVWRLCRRPLRGPDR